jgi:pseudouridine-5'-phosphate glycosidase/pseudouridine kinase
MNDLSLGSEFRMDLEQLAKRNVLDQDSSKGTLSFLVDNGIAQMAVNLVPFFQNIIIKGGERGLLVALRISGKDIESSGWSQESSNPSRRYVVARGQSSQEMFVLQHFPPPTVENIVNVTGAGDTLVGVLLACLVREPTAFLHPDTLSDTIHFAQKGAALTLQSVHAVSPLLCQLGK